MSNQTYLKSDRISFAKNLAEEYIVANNSNSIAFGPIGIATLNLDGTIQSINTTNAIVFSNQYIYGDASYLLNIPTPLNQTSTLDGLGTLGYISSSQLISTVTGINEYISSFIDPTELTSTVVGLATEGYLSTAVSESNLTSTTQGLGSIGYISSSQLISTVTGLGSAGYLSTVDVTSSIIGLEPLDIFQVHN